jgi:kynureninase
MNFQNTAAFANELDETDNLKSFRDKFYIPIINGNECIYFTGNSLGLQPKTTQDYVVNELEDWANYGVEGHYRAISKYCWRLATGSGFDEPVNCEPSFADGKLLPPNEAAV